MIRGKYYISSIALSFTIELSMFGTLYTEPQRYFSMIQLIPKPTIDIGTTIGTNGAQNAVNQIVFNTQAYLQGIWATGPYHIQFAYICVTLILQLFTKQRQTFPLIQKQFISQRKKLGVIAFISMTTVMSVGRFYVMLKLLMSAKKLASTTNTPVFRNWKKLIFTVNTVLN